MLTGGAVHRLHVNKHNKSRSAQTSPLLPGNQTSSSFVILYLVEDRKLVPLSVHRQSTMLANKHV